MARLSATTINILELHDKRSKTNFLRHYDAGPVTCVACHTVNKKGIPVQLRGTDYYDDYWSSVVLIHLMREGDQKMPVSELTRKYPYRRTKEVVPKGWR